MRNFYDEYGNYSWDMWDGIPLNLMYKMFNMKNYAELILFFMNQ